MNQERFAITWVSSAEPDKFVKAVTEMTEKIKKLGPIQDQAQAVHRGGRDGSYDCFRMAEFLLRM